MKRFVSVSLVALLVVLAGTAMAGPWGRGMGQGFRGYGLGACPCVSANLTPQQTAQLQSLRETYLKEVSPLQTELFNKRLQMRNLWASAQPDQARISALQKEITAIQGQLQEKRLQYGLEARKLVNP